MILKKISPNELTALIQNKSDISIVDIRESVSYTHLRAHET